MDQEKEIKRERCFDYPDETIGMRGAAEARALTNNLSEEEVEKLYQLGKRIAFGGGDLA